MTGRLWAFALCWALALPGGAALLAAEAVSLDELLQEVKSGRAVDAKENAERIERFKNAADKQRELLEQARQELNQEEARSQRLEQEFEQNETRRNELEQAFNERMGDLKELFGTLQQAAGDARAQFENSIINAQYPERTEFLAEFARQMGQVTRLPALEDIERLWFELQREMTESGKIVRYPTQVVTASGDMEQRQVVRVGTFNTVSAGRYLEYVPETGRLLELSRQPPRRFLNMAMGLGSATDGVAPFALDPTRGQILSLLVQTPNLQERIDQGGVVGYIIIGLGVIALVVALERLIVLAMVSAKVRRQTRSPDNPGNNPLGRVLQVYHANPRADVETLELKLAEAVLKETPGLNRALLFLKIIAVVAPLLGLLGTVTGMIVTFQAITLFGTGDPKLMAGGISQALVTTVLGLCVAIPTVLLHAVVASRARRLTQILEEQATGMVAEQAERLHAAAA